ncbi:MAG: hypothetical protein ACJ8GN_04855 [Longimicrobiaceae bacterium]
MSPVHLHLLMNQLPVAGTALGVFILARGVARHDEALDRASLVIFVVAAAATGLAFLTGERAEAGMTGVSGALIDRHHHLARLATGALGVLGAASLLTLAAFRRRALPRWLPVLLLAASLVPVGALVWTVNRGAEIRSREEVPATAVHAEEVGAYEP